MKLLLNNIVNCIVYLYLLEISEIACDWNIQVYLLQLSDLEYNIVLANIIEYMYYYFYFSFCTRLYYLIPPKIMHGDWYINIILFQYKLIKIYEKTISL